MFGRRFISYIVHISITMNVQLVFCLVLLGSCSIFVVSQDVPDEESLETTTTAATESSVNVRNRESCSLPNGIDIEFLNRSSNNLILIYGTPVDEICEVDTLLDRLMPELPELSEEFQLKKAVRTESVGETLDIFRRLLERSNNYTAGLGGLFQKLTPKLAPLVYQVQTSPKCLAAIVHLSSAIRKNELWALKFLDASAKLPSGVLEGRLSIIGDYEQCLSIRTPNGGDEESPKYRGKFCFLKPIIPHPERSSPKARDINSKTSGSVQIPPALADDIVDMLYVMNGTFFRFGVCLPSVCDAAEIELTLNSFLYPLMGVPIQVGPECQQETEVETFSIEEKIEKFDFYQKLALGVFASLFSLSVLASIFDLLTCSVPNEKTPEELPQKTDQNGNIETESTKRRTENKRSVGARLILSFSIVSNTRQMFTPDTKVRFASVDFIRFLMLVEVIVMHQYYVGLGWSAWPLSSRMFSTDSLFTSAGSADRYAFLRNIHNTDFFFALTGMLLTYSTLGTLERRSGSFSYVWYCVSMYLRFYPAVFGAILMYYILPLLGSGPFWSLLDDYYVETCRRNLMANVLSYNYYILDMEEFTHHSMCNISSWWVTSCFHLVLLAPLLLIPMYRFGGWGFAWSVVVLIFGSAASAAHIWYQGTPFMNQLTSMSSILEDSFYSIFYTWPFIHHIGPFVAGMLVGYLIRRAPKMQLGGRIGELLLSIVFIGSTMFSFHWTETMLRGDVDLGELIVGPKAPGISSNIEVYLNVTMGKLMFVSGFLWLFYLCCTDRAKWLNRNLFTWPWLKPMYSLAMGLYLTNFIAPLYFAFSTRDVIEFNDRYVLRSLPANFSITVVLSYILHVLFEKPVMNILKIIE